MKLGDLKLEGTVVFWLRDDYRNGNTERERNPTHIGRYKQ